ncbi:unnamed protein product [Dovyalis caffra]|uniref:HSF-type DNA-binding domain-containing protein n=1 Tax=Dovyalis caffra TaxID=77055 RepID=A0AAV1RFU4_9ROSI|nr:unnamed protein product [Dovyalis caffra]
MVDDSSTDSVVSWSSSDNSFVVWNVPEFQRDLLPKYFKHGNFSSFVRQLNTYSQWISSVEFLTGICYLDEANQLDSDYLSAYFVDFNSSLGTISCDITQDLLEISSGVAVESEFVGLQIKDMSLWDLLRKISLDIFKYGTLLGAAGIAGSVVAYSGLFPYYSAWMNDPVPNPLLGHLNYLSLLDSRLLLLSAYTLIGKVDPDRFEFANEGFLRGQKHLLRSISRKKTVPVHGNQPPQVQNSPVASCVEVGKFGLEEEVERLKRDKNVLMQELVRLRQQQQATDHQLLTVGQRVQGMEQRQQQMMSFLAKAMQSPGFLSQLEEENLADEQCKNSPNGQIIKFHSSMNEAAKAMLHQILKMNSSPRLEQSMNSSGPLLIGNHPSSNGLDSGSSSTRMSGVMLSEVPPTSGPSYLPIETGFPASHPTTAISEVQPRASVATDHIKADFTEIGMHNSGQNTILPNFTAMPGIVPGGSAGVPNMNIAGPENDNTEFIDAMSSVLDAPVAVETEAFSPNPKLPGINDVFWEQFLTASPINGETEDEINSSSPESSMSKEHDLQSWQDDGWDNIQHMNHLAEQMGLLTPETSRG